MLKQFKESIKQRYCNHEFHTCDMQPRDKHGIVKWPCHKCARLFQAECGIDILSNGKCIGRWGTRETNKPNTVEGE